jgi:hypothetical protein
MKQPARKKVAPGALDPRAKESPFTMTMGGAHREKLQRMLGFCLMNGVGANHGVILRTLLEHAPEKSAELIGQVQAQMALEKAETREKRRLR